MQKNDLELLINYISKLPSVGKRSAKRIALHLLKNKENLMFPLAKAITDTAQNIKKCSECGNYDISEICNICSNEKRNHEQVCVVENVEDLWAIERGNIYNGVYHILGGALSAIDGISPDDLNLKTLLAKIQAGKVKEVILATNATIEGQTTAHFVSGKLRQYNVKISRLAFGIPLGGELDYLDEGTLLTALETRREL
ncbi:MAG TPA: recombination protein RecR [Alphaproteobacteria bacterium]|nr:recombination protein RecR [Alphaproteobacteria bacterium]